MHDHAGRVQHAAEPRPPRALELGAQALAQVAGIRPGADLLPRALDHTPGRVDRQRVVHAAGELVHRREVSQLHDRSVPDPPIRGLPWARAPILPARDRGRDCAGVACRRPAPAAGPPGGRPLGARDRGHREGGDPDRRERRLGAVGQGRAPAPPDRLDDEDHDRDRRDGAAASSRRRHRRQVGHTRAAVQGRSPAGRAGRGVEALLRDAAHVGERHGARARDRRRGFPFALRRADEREGQGARPEGLALPQPERAPRPRQLLDRLGHGLACPLRDVEPALPGSRAARASSACRGRHRPTPRST